ncbi:MAG: SNF2-related protein [Gemmatimonadaceae bacterium]
MSIPTEIAALFSKPTRDRGAAYQRAGRVDITEVAHGKLSAEVHGTECYEVTVDVDESGTLDYACSCPFFPSALECKHVWATLLEADHRKLLDLAQRLEPPRLPNSPERSAAAPVVPGNSAHASSHSSWRRTLKGLARELELRPPLATAATWPTNRRLAYVVDAFATQTGGQGVVIELATQLLDKRGQWKPPKRFSLSAEQWLAIPDGADREIAQMLLGAQEAYSYRMPRSVRRYVIGSNAFDTTLRRICDTGRCFVRLPEPNAQLRALSWDAGDAWRFCVEFTRDAGSGAYHMAGHLERGAVRMPIDEPEAVVPEGLIIAHGVAARLVHSDAFGLLSTLRAQRALRIPADEMLDMLRSLYALPHLPPITLPPEAGIEEVRMPPVPRLSISKPGPNIWMRDVAAGDLSFDYAGMTIGHDHRAHALFDADRRRVIQRDRAAERAALERLRRSGFHAARVYYNEKQTIQGPWPRVDALATELMREGWQITVEGREYRSAGESHVEVSSGIDWFDLHVVVDFGGVRATLPALLAALRSGSPTVPLDDGTFGLLPTEVLARYATLSGLGSVNGDTVRFARTQVGFLDAMLSALPDARVDETFARARETLRGFDGIAPVDAPEHFVGTLRPYQRDGLGWLGFLREFSFGGCLADDMGLGKTVQVLALLEARRTERCAPSLVVAPRSVVYNWRLEAARFAPELRVLEHMGAGRARTSDALRDADLVLTSYGTLRRDIALLKEVEFDYAILDEAQTIKNSNTASAKASRLLRARHRLALTGTPLENRLGDLWSIFEFLNPGMLGAASLLKRLGDSNGGDDSRALLARALRPFVLRRTKQQVARDLPEKQEQTLYVELEPVQRKLYDELRDHYRAALLERVASQGIARFRIQILEALLRLRQAACHPGLIDKSRVGEPSAKLDALLPQLAEIVAEDHKVLVFSQFTSLLAIVRERLDAEDISYEYLDGRTKDRQARVDRFQEDPACGVFLISLKAGGLGLNLMAAEYVFLLDPWWNPAVEAQAIDRAHRIGQTRQVFATRLIARDTVEEKVLQLQERKRELADGIITADNSVIAQMGREELELLLS